MTTKIDPIGELRVADAQLQEAYENFQLAVGTYLVAMEIQPTQALSFLANLIGDYAGTWTLSADQHEAILNLSRARYRQVIDQIMAETVKS